MTAASRVTDEGLRSCINTLLEVEHGNFPDETCMQCENIGKCEKLYIGTFEEGRKLRVCLLARFFDLRNFGIGRYSQEILRELNSRGEFEIKTMSQDGGIPIGQGMMKYFTYTAFESALKIPKADIYHAMSPMEAIYAPKPLVVTFHDFVPLHLSQVDTHYAESDLEKRFVSRYFGMACSIASKNADVVTAVSEQTKRELKQRYNVDSEVIRHGINPELEPIQQRNKTFRVGTLGGLDDPRKRHNLLIRAFLDADVDGELLIGGDGRGDWRRKLLKMASGDSRVNFLGFVPDDELKNFYNSLDALILTTKFEGYCLPAVEAMACRTPVVTLFDAIIPPEVKNRTIVVDDLRSWLESPDFSDADLDDAYRFAKLHDWGTAARRLSEIYNQLGVKL